MNDGLLIGWVISILCFVLSILLIMGKGSFLIAGYNTSTKEQKAKYDKPKLCRVVGIGFLIISLILMVFTYYQFELPSYLNWIMPWGYLGTITITGILANTICLKKN